MLSISHSSYPVCNPRKIIANMKSHVIREIVKYVCCEKKLGGGGGTPSTPTSPCSLLHVCACFSAIYDQKNVLGFLN